MTKNDSIKKQFSQSLKLGTGKAYLIFTDYPDVDFTKSIINAAVTNLAYDPQCEGSRAKYLYQFIKGYKHEKKIVDNILDHLLKEKDDDWGIYQMYDLAAIFYKAGYDRAKTVAYERFEKSRLDKFEVCGAEQIVEMDGLVGLLKVAEILGERIYNNDDWEDNFLTEEFQKKNKHISIYNILKTEAKNNKYINAYYQSILEHNFYSKNRKRLKFSYDLIKQRIAQNTLRFMSEASAMDLSKTEVLQLAKDFLDENDEERQISYLVFFSKRKFPVDYSKIFQIAKYKSSKKTRLVHYAIGALKYFSSSEIRSFAIDKLKTKKNPCDYIPLLVSNYKNGDNKFLVEILNRSNNDDFIHSVAISILEVYAANRTPECKVPLEIIYNKMNCGIHRKNVTTILMHNNVLPDPILSELKFDSDDDVRKQYKSFHKHKD